MEHEVSLAMEVSITLFVLSLVISIIWFSVSLGKDMANSTSDEASRIITIETVGVLEDMKTKENVMPASAAYSILRTYSNYIPEYYCNERTHTTPIFKDLTIENPCIVEHMTGKVSVEVTDSIKGGYKVIIHHMNCDWFDNSSYNTTTGTRCAGCVKAFREEGT